MSADNSLTDPERSIHAARFLRKVPAKYHRMLLRDLTIAELAYGDIFTLDVYGW